MDILIVDGKAYELFPNGAPELHPSLQVVKNYVGQVEPMWEWDGSTFIAPPAPVIDYKAKAAARRYEEETKGIVFNGVSVKTDRESQALITGATVSVILDPSLVINWKTDAGAVPLDSAAMTAIAQAVRDHVQACFDRELEIIAAIDGGTFTEDMLDQGWPV